MTQGVVAQDRVSRVGWTGGVLSWLVAGAAFSFVAGVVKVGIWVNHWYVAERFYDDVNEATKEGPYWNITQLLRSGNEALLNGLSWLGIAILCVLVAAVVRRRRSR